MIQLLNSLTVLSPHSKFIFLFSGNRNYCYIWLNKLKNIILFYWSIFYSILYLTKTLKSTKNGTGRELNNSFLMANLHLFFKVDNFSSGKASSKREIEREKAYLLKWKWQKRKKLKLQKTKDYVILNKSLMVKSCQ